MNLSVDLISSIIIRAHAYLGLRQWSPFGCVRFVRRVYADVGIALPILSREDCQPKEFHLPVEGFVVMPLGHSVFLRRKASKAPRIWTHVVIIVSKEELIHCSDYFGSRVVITSRTELLEVYDLARQAAL